VRRATLVRAVQELSSPAVFECRGRGNPLSPLLERKPRLRGLLLGAYRARTGDPPACKLNRGFSSLSVCLGPSDLTAVRARPRLTTEAGYADRVEQPWRPNKPELDDGDRKLHADVERYGVALPSRPWRGRAAVLSFSIGVFQTWEHPELGVFGLKDTVAHELLTQVVERINAGEVLRLAATTTTSSRAIGAASFVSIHSGTRRSSATRSGSTRAKTGFRRSSS
jgi:uncharacterized protein DUF4262